MTSLQKKKYSNIPGHCVHPFVCQQSNHFLQNDQSSGFLLHQRDVCVTEGIGIGAWDVQNMGWGG